MYFSKLIGYLFVVSGCCGLGIWYSLQFQKRVFHIKEMIRILNIMVSEITYGQSTLPECYRKIVRKTSQPYRSAFEKILRQNMRTEGSSFVELGQKILEEELQSCPLKEEKDIFIKCFTDVGYEDTWMQLKTLERGKTDLQNVLDAEEKELKSKSKLAISLGAMCGLLLVLILI